MADGRWWTDAARPGTPSTRGAARAGCRRRSERTRGDLARAVPQAPDVHPYADPGRDAGGPETDLLQAWCQTLNLRRLRETGDPASGRVARRPHCRTPSARREERCARHPQRSTQSRVRQPESSRSRGDLSPPPRSDGSRASRGAMRGRRQAPRALPCALPYPSARREEQCASQQGSPPRVVKGCPNHRGTGENAVLPCKPRALPCALPYPSARREERCVRHPQRSTQSRVRQPESSRNRGERSSPLQATRSAVRFVVNTMHVARSNAHRSSGAHAESCAAAEPSWNGGKSASPALRRKPRVARSDARPPPGATCLM